MLKAFEELGDGVTQAWRARDYDEAAFADIATRALSESQVLQTTTAADIARWFLTSSRIPQQSYRDFGQPPLTLYLGHNLIIEALYWVDSTTAVHEHGFSGAFGVLAGSSVHSQHHFELKERISSRMLLGRLRTASCEILNRGAVRTIRAANKFIHSLFHLDCPSVSIVVRTINEVEHNPQYAYQRPSIALDPFYKPEPFLTQLRLLDTLKKVDLELFWQSARNLVRTCDLWMTLMILRIAYQKSGDAEGWNALVDNARERHGGRVDYLLPALEEQRRERMIIALRESVREAEHRFFLALLLNVQSRGEIFKLISDRFQEENPEGLVLRWVEELSRCGLAGLDFDFRSVKMLQGILRDMSFEDTSRFLAKTSPHNPDEDNESLETTWRRVKDNLLLRPLVRP